MQRRLVLVAISTRTSRCVQERLHCLSPGLPKKGVLEFVDLAASEDQANRRLEEISSTLFGVGALLKAPKLPLNPKPYYRTPSIYRGDPQVDQRIQIVEGASTYFRRKCLQSCGGRRGAL